MSQRKINPAKTVIQYRYIPGAVGDGMPWDNGAVMSQEFRLTASRDKRLAELKSDQRTQWAKAVQP